MKRIYTYILTLLCIACFSLPAKALSGAEIAQLNKQAAINVTSEKANKTVAIAKEMVQLADTKSRSASPQKALFFIKEKAYWQRIQNDAQQYAYNPDLKNNYFESKDYWTAVSEKYTTALGEFPDERDYWVDALGQLEKLDEISIGPNSCITPIESHVQYHKDKDLNGFDARYSLIPKIDETEPEAHAGGFGMIGMIELIIIIFGILVVIVCAIIVIFVVTRKNKKNTPTPPPFSPTDFN